ncbi:non-ribosomal peptide synthetase [Cellulosilyticum ruminicola]|uniref:non-ribosomal peptide synthetase n=1 Tax=Cellulosilyticum ruminicola TaxID=425254 RepID=UPI0006D2830E|nr:non-ribosomal peptide synthetase [Cellulosilyticum ruminicola]
MNKDIAIIGIAGRFPDAANLDELFVNMKVGKDSIREIDKQRIKDTALPPDGKYYIGGYLTDIDKFDYKLFNISKGEAEAMSPTQRMLLEVVYETFESSGYGCKYFDGSDTAVFVSASSSDYYELADKFSPTLISGNADAYLPSVIARQFNLTGNAQYINTACSSSLAIIHNACNELLLGNAEYALACGANIYIFPYSKLPYSDEDKMNLDSPDGKSKAFSNDANGMSYGESVSCVLLKKLDKAIEDQDMIYAVIKNTAVNNNAAKSDSIKAVDSIAQAELIEKVCDTVHINPASIGYIEAHGSGTKLGDALEIEGLNKVFKKHTDQKKIAPVSTIKSNIGHTRMAAGICGLVRAVLALENKVIFPTANFKTPSELIDFENASVYVSTELKDWVKKNDEPRYAGVTSLGESGINCHVLLEEAPVRKPIASNKTEEYLVTLSSKSQDGLIKNASVLRKKLEESTTLNINDISYTLNKGRNHYKYRFSAVVHDVNELNLKLDEFISTKRYDESKKHSLDKLIMVIADQENQIQMDLVNLLKDKYPIVKKSMDECAAVGNLENKYFLDFAVQYSVYRLFEYFGITSEHLLCMGIGEIIYDVIQGESSLEEAAKLVEEYEYEPLDNLEQRIEKLLNQEVTNTQTVFLGTGYENNILRVLRKYEGEKYQFTVIDLVKENNIDPFIKIVQLLYLNQYEVDFAKFHDFYKGLKIALPSYQFEKDRCWLRDKPRQQNEKINQGVEELLVEKDASELELLIAHYWHDALENIGSFSVKDNFFEIGGTSLKATQIINKIAKHLSIKLSFEDIFDYSEVGLLAEYIDSLLSTKQKMAMFWKEILKVETLEDSDDFFELGGHSLLASQVLIKIKKEFGVELNFEDMFKHSTLKALADLIDQLKVQEKNSVDIYEIPKASKKAYYPLSSAQRRIYILQEMDQDVTNYNVSGALIIEGKLDVDKLNKAFNTLIERHEALRTSFTIVGDEVVQQIHDKVDFKIEEEDTADQDVNQMMKGFVKNFDLQSAPLLRVKLVTLQDKKQHILLYDTHHIVVDGTSMKLMIDELAILYSGGQLKPIQVQYKDYAQWQTSKEWLSKIEKQKAYWLDVFEGDIPVLNLPYDYPRPAEQSFEGDSVSFVINKQLTEYLNKIAKETDTTLYMVLLSICHILLAKYSGQDDIAIGTPIAGRNSIGIEKTIGMFVNTLVMRNKIDSEKSYKDFLSEVKQNALKAYEYQDYPFEDLVDQVDKERDLSRNALFDVMFALQNEGGNEAIAVEGIKISPCLLESNTSKFDILVNATLNQDEICITLEYSCKLFKKETIQRMCKHFINIIKDISEDKEICIKEIDLLREEKRAILVDLNNTYREYEAEKTIVSLFEEQVVKTPQCTAIVCQGEAITYNELNQRSNQYARKLKELQVESGDIVGLLMERSSEMISCLLGVLKAGATYLPIDPNYPQGRIAYMLDNSCAKVILTDENSIHKLNDSYRNAINIDDVDIASYECTNLTTQGKAEDLLYVIYTSGTTGKPKGVMITNRNMVNLICHEYNSSEIDFSERVLQFTTSSFDVCYQEVFSTLLKGGSLYIIDEEGKRDINYLFEFIAANTISVVFLPTALIKSLMTDKEYVQAIPNSIKHIITAGEQLILSEYLQEYLLAKDICLHNHYGPAETHVVTTYTINKDNVTKQPPIGKPIQNTGIYILNEHMQVQPIGVYGEIYIAGDSVGKGYIDNSELTQMKFIKNPVAHLIENEKQKTIHSEYVYATGDIGRWRADGNIEYLGRMDHQVKIRGYRVETSEIEVQLMKCEHINQVTVVARSEDGIASYLCAYYVADETVSVDELKSYLAMQLPEYMIPSYFIKLEKLPTLPNGKINKKVLPNPSKEVGIGTQYVAPTNEVEKQLIEIWQELFEIKKIGIQDNFFELGGHSLKVAILRSKINSTFKIDYPFKKIFNTPTIKAMAEYITANKVEYHEASPIEVVEEKPYYELSAAQKRMYFLCQMQSTAYNMSSATKIEGHLEKKKLEDALYQIINRHEALRTSFVNVNGKIMQKIHLDFTFNLDYLMCKEDEVEQVINEFIRPFNLDEAPLFRAKLLSITDTEHILLVDMPHIVADGVSLKILINEILQIYEGNNLKPLKLQYKDYSEWQNRCIEGNKLKKYEDYWLDLYKDGVPQLELPTDYPRPSVQNYEGDIYTFNLDEELTAALRKLSTEKNCTVYMILLATFNVLLSKITHQEDIVLGMPVVGRDYEDLYNMVGVCLNTIAIRNKPEFDKSFKVFLDEVRESILKGYENQEYPFEMLIDRLQISHETSRNPLFDIAFNLQDVSILGPNAESSLGELKFSMYDFNRRLTNFDMIFFVYDYDKTVTIKCDYRTSLFKHSTIVYIMQQYLLVIKEAIKNPNQKIKDFQAFLSSQLKGKKNTIVPMIDFERFKEVEKYTNVIERFEEIAQRYPDRVAIRWKNEDITYEMLNRKTDQIGTYLAKEVMEQINVPNVAILFEHGAQMIEGMLGVLKAGKTYVPLDPSYPQGRLIYMLEDSRAQVIITNNVSLQLARELAVKGKQHIINIDELDLENIPVVNKTKAQLEDIAFIIYTSGSTGKPKGVMHSHNNTLNYISMYSNEITLNKEDKVGLFTSYSHAVAVIDIFAALLNGACICPYNLKADDNELNATKWLLKEEITVYHSIPQVFRYCVKSLQENQIFSKIRLIILGGEAVYNKDVELAKKYFAPECQMVNLLGASEVLVGTFYYVNKALDVARNTVPVGYPFKDMEVLLLNEKDEEVSVYEVGEIVYCSKYLSEGYWKNEGKTNEVFQINPITHKDRVYRSGDLGRMLPTGEIEYMGRKDFQIKIRGYRIEPGEIESCLLECSGILEAAVVAFEDDINQKYLVAYVVGEESLDGELVEKQLTKKLPTYMIPSQLVLLDKMPLTPNGKIDRNTLPKPEKQVSETQEMPCNEIEQQLLEICKEYLQAEDISVDQSFFDIGGQSLMAVELTEKIREVFHVNIKLRHIIESSTIREIAQHIAEQEKIK